MQEEDYEILRAERDASPARYAQWDRSDQLRREYIQQHGHNGRPGDPQRNMSEQSVAQEAVATPHVLSRQNSASSTSTSSSTASHSTRAPRLEEIRTARSTGQTHDNSTGFLSRHPTERDPEALRRIETHRSQHAGTVGASQVPSRLTQTLSRRRTDRPLPSLGAGKPMPPPLPDRDEYVVEFDGVDDPRNAQNWPLKRKIGLGAVLAFDAITATMGSSIFSSATLVVSAHFDVGREVGTLATSLFVFGYAFGPLMWAPFSELYGRKTPLIIAAFGFSVFTVAVAVAKDIQTVLICRFFAGLFGSSPLAIVAAVFADMFDNKTRGMAVAVFSLCVFLGPMLAPFIGGFITESYLGWRWTMYISALMGFASFTLLILFMQETYAPVVLINKASEMRRRTKNWGIHAKQEEIEVDLKELIVRNVSRPLRILFTEPIVLLVTIYMSFVYGILYLLLTAYPLVFTRVYGWNSGVSGLAYFGLIAGQVIAFIVIIAMNGRYVRKLEANNNIPVPEWRLPISMVGGVAFAAGLFWFGWSGYSGTVHWIVPILSGLLTGFGLFTIFLSLLNYIVDAYLMFAASALAANTFMRSCFGGVFPLFATYMFEGMGVQWACTLIGGVALLLVPMPIMFYMYGKKIRAKSTFAPAPDIAQDRRRDEEARVGLAEDGGLGSAESDEGIQKQRSKEQ
ncbi:MFS general substrate transporter [Dothidotthia symphoricarpi CBS 119687]|uniref:MFS general substrate transporter n=1 Tax=Dothidotthia symphoricarpi CBS 119687 TaxID=1392245 RepID=A0A6A6AP50_9PLEO|nr:MFS general substrate transporter [Dothidotthia symphoricarpi CBS 119687]KAF2133772.1 MFS general substrate transporter [Dothidotthia symphoricarpi CBS 119687]